MSRILAFAGSARKKSFNKKMVAIAAKGAEDAGAEVTLVDVADYPMPLFNQDEEMEKGMPEKVKAFKQLFIEHDGLLIASPEYNSCFTPLLKNTIDWCSRKEHDDEPKLAAFQGKMVAIMAASPGAFGGMKGLIMLRMLLSSIGMIVLPEQRVIPKAAQAFDDAGQLIDQQQQQSILGLGQQLSQMLSKY